MQPVFFARVLADIAAIFTLYVLLYSAHVRNAAVCHERVDCGRHAADDQIFGV